MKIRSRSPLRLGFGGGGTDLSSYCNVHGGYILNATIDQYAYAFLEPPDEPLIRLIALDQKIEREYPLADFLQTDGVLDLHKGVYNRIVKQFNNHEPLPVILTTFSDAPPGSGLGSSSTLVVALLNSFVEYLNLPVGEYDMAHLAFEIERIDIGLNGGKQDQYAATFGGFNFMEFYANDRVIVNPLRIKDWIVSELEMSLVLFFTGISRDSAWIIEEQTKNVSEGQLDAVTAMHELKKEALLMKEALLRGELLTFAERMERGWLAKKRTAGRVSNPMIDSIYEGAKRNGAIAGKASGAGGGGFIMFMVDPQRRIQLISYLKGLEGSVFNFRFTNQGTQSWRVE